LRRLLRWVIGIPVFIVVIGFAVANRNWTQLSLDPFNQAQPTVYVNLPLWLLAFLGIFVGILVGWFFCWLNQGKWRKLARERQREITKLQGDIAMAKLGPEKIEAQLMAPLPGILP